jgi:hypothetical protein
LSLLEHITNFNFTAGVNMIDVLLCCNLPKYIVDRALESLKIMDYSLLVGIHNIDQAAGRKGGGGGSHIGGEDSWAGPISWDPEEGSGGDYNSGQQRRPAMLERIGKINSVADQDHFRPDPDQNSDPDPAL